MKDIKGYEGLYAITEDGKVWSYRSNRFLKTNINRSGYQYVVVSVGGERKTFTIHKLVAEAFIPNPEGKQQVNHKDEDKTNNKVENLEWMTAIENVNYGTRTLRTQTPVYCVELDRVFDGVREAARELGLHHNNISAVCRGRLNQTGGYHWQYVEK